MSDLISRQAAIDTLNKLDVSDGVGISSIACGVQESAIIAVQKLPSVQTERWIPVSERLPNVWDERYLVSLAWGGIGVMEYKSTGFHNYGSFTPVPIKSIIAWMPLPEPYKGEQE